MSRVARSGLTQQQQTQILIEIARTAQYSFELLDINVDEKITETLTITNITTSSGTVTVHHASTLTPPPVGTTIFIDGVNPTGYNGYKTVTASTSTSFSFSSATATSYVSGGTATWTQGFQTHTVYITNGGFDVTYDGNVYIALGQFLSVSDIQETGDLQVNTVNIGLSGIPSDILNLFFNYIYTNRRVVVRRAYFNEINLLIGAITIFDGRMDKPVVQDDPNSSTVVAVECRNQWADFERKSGRHTNNNEQQAFFPGDKGFEYSSQVVQDIKWGG